MVTVAERLADAPLAMPSPAAALETAPSARPALAATLGAAPPAWPALAAACTSYCPGSGSSARLFDRDSGTEAGADVPESRSNNLARDLDPGQ